MTIFAGNTFGQFEGAAALLWCGVQHMAGEAFRRVFCFRIEFQNAGDALADITGERRRCGLRLRARKTGRGTTPRSSKEIWRRFAFEEANESFASLSCGSNRRRVVFFAAWREKETGRLFTRRRGASSMQENPYCTLRRATKLARRSSMRDAAP
jgi:hypothetical protein